MKKKDEKKPQYRQKRTLSGEGTAAPGQNDENTYRLSMSLCITFLIYTMELRMINVLNVYVLSTHDYYLI